MFFLLLESFPADVLISNFVILHSSQIFEELVYTVKIYEQSKARISGDPSYITMEDAQNLWVLPVRVIGRNERKSQEKEKKHAVEDMYRRLLELSFIVKKHGSVTARAPASYVGRYKKPYIDARVYYGRMGHTIANCCKTNRESKVCDFCKKKGHTADDCWVRV